MDNEPKEYKIDPKEIPELVDLMQRLHGYLVNDYLDETGEHSHSCTVIAFDIAKVLIDHGLDPDILSIRGEVTDEVGNRGAIQPKIYDGRISWGAHVVCRYAGKIYDPMLGEPMNEESYLLGTFDRPVEATIAMDTDTIKERL